MLTHLATSLPPEDDCLSQRQLKRQKHLKREEVLLLGITTNLSQFCSLLIHFLQLNSFKLHESVRNIDEETSLVEGNVREKDLPSSGFTPVQAHIKRRMETIDLWKNITAAQEHKKQLQVTLNNIEKL